MVAICSSVRVVSSGGCVVSSVGHNVSSVGHNVSSEGLNVSSVGHNVSSVDLGQAVATEARECHQIHVLNVGAHLQQHRTVSG